MNGLYTILLLLLSNVFMTLAWYGHLKLSQTGISNHWPLVAVIAFSWGIAFFEYCCQVPANRLGFIDNGGPFNLVLRVYSKLFFYQIFNRKTMAVPAEPALNFLSFHCLITRNNIFDCRRYKMSKMRKSCRKRRSIVKNVLLRTFSLVY